MTGVMVEPDDRVPPEPVVPTVDQVLDYLNFVEAGKQTD